MCSMIYCDQLLTNWVLLFYAGNKKCYAGGLTSSFTDDTVECGYIIPFENFNPKNFGETLKYNIVKNNQ